jgi:hypothetical protein
MFVYVSVCVYVYVCECVYVCVYLCVCMYVYMCVILSGCSRRPRSSLSSKPTLDSMSIYSSTGMASTFPLNLCWSYFRPAWIGVAAVAHSAQDVIEVVVSSHNYSHTFACSSRYTGKAANSILNRELKRISRPNCAYRAPFCVQAEGPGTSTIPSQEP